MADGISPQPVGIIDIGSNSVRLVVFAGASRNPIPLFNERVLAGLGRHLASTGCLDPEGVERALKALGRFRAISEALEVGSLRAVATAAVRDARDGAAFVKAASEACGVAVEVLSGREEARFTSLGVLSGIPEARGLVGDLGGGSLELLTVAEGQVGRGTTLPIGGLRLLDSAGGDIETARRVVDEALERVPWLGAVEGHFYAVGGAWRTLARIHMRQSDYYLHMLQNYRIQRRDALALARVIAVQSPASLSRMPGISGRRVDSLPYSAVVLERVLLHSRVRDVVISANGLREGVLYDGLPEALKSEDALRRACLEMAGRLGRSLPLGRELGAWTAALFARLDGPESAGERRLREAICLLSDIEWRSHPDHRGTNAFGAVLFGPLGAVDHVERFFIACGVYHRYEEHWALDLPGHLPPLEPERRQRARRIGLAVRLGITLCGGATGILPRCPLGMAGRCLVLKVPPAYQGLIGEAVHKHLASLARALGCDHRLESAAS